MQRKKYCVIVVPELYRLVNDFKILNKYLTDAGWSVKIFFPEQKNDNEGWASEDLQKSTIEALHPSSISALPISTRPSKPSIWELLKTSGIGISEAWKNKNTLFIIWSAFSLILFGPWLRILNRKSLYLVTGLGASFSERQEGSLRQRLICLLYRFLFSTNRARVIVHNKEDKQELVNKTGVSPGQVFVTGGCGVVPELYDYDPVPISFPEKPVIIVPSRILRDKGVLEAAEASSILSEKGIKHRMLFTMDPWFGREDSITKEELEQAKSFPDVEFIGYQKDMIEVYRNADVVCIPSWYREGLQTAILESSAAGVPIVACDNFGVRDFVTSKKEALVAEPKNPQSLADKLEEMLNTPEMANQLRLNARARLLGGFTSKHMLDITLNAISELDERI